MKATKTSGHLILRNGFTAFLTLITRSSFLTKLTIIVKSTIPFLAFLLVYFYNGRLHILPVMNDIACVHMYTINAMEEFVFGCHPHRLVSKYHYPVLDFISAIPYLMHYVLPIAVPLYLFLKGNVEDVARFYWLLGYVMWIHYFFWMAFPHTPPWVIDNLRKSSLNSLHPLIMKHKEGCAFARLDKFTGIPFFFNMFSGNPIPFASFPSGHVSWATISYMSARHSSNFFAGYILLVVWATLYSCHHYLTDALGALIIVTLTHKVLQYLSDKKVCSYKSRNISAGSAYQV